MNKPAPKIPLSDAALSAARKCTHYMIGWVSADRQLNGTEFPCEEFDGQWFAETVQQAIEEAVDAGQHHIKHESPDNPARPAISDGQWDERNNPAHYVLGYLAAGYMNVFTSREANERHRLRTASLLESVLSKTAILELARECRQQYRNSSNDKEVLSWE